MDPKPLPATAGPGSASGSDASIRKRRAMTQGQKACNPCRQRKVRCSYESPCQTCVERQHPELCKYDARLKRIQLVPGPAGSPLGASSTRLPPGDGPEAADDWDALLDKLDRLEEGLRDVRKELARRRPPARPDGDNGSAASDDAGRAPDMHAAHRLTGETVFLGANSAPAVAMAISQQAGPDAARDLLDRSILPIFTLENESATYPFVDLWGLPHASPERIQKLCALLPSNADCFQHLRQYRDTAHVLFPGIINMQRFEAEVTHFLVTRGAEAVNPHQPPLTAQGVYGKSVHWLGLLFACLASGCQCSNLPRRERQLTSQVYVCCAYECLRLINYLSCSQLEDIQNLLVLGNVLSNNMNAGVAWTLLGLTIRLAQGMGLHHAPPPQTPPDEVTLRHEIWARVIWQDSLLSISYDRATPTTAMTRWESAAGPGPERFTYADCMLQLCTIALDVVGNRRAPMTTQREVQRIDTRREEVSAIDRQSSGHLRDSSACASMKDHLEHWNWHMHRSYVVSELCRPMLAKWSDRHDDEVRRLRGVCVEALADTVEAFLHLQNLTVFARTSWAAVHRSLSSALLLGIMKASARDNRIRSLLERLVAVMSSLEYMDASEVPGPVARAVSALVQLNEAEGSDYSMSPSDAESPHQQMHNILWGPSSGSEFSPFY